MKKILILITLLTAFNIKAAENYLTQNKVVDVKYGYKLGDLIVIQDKIISNKKFIKIPELIVKKNKDLKFIKQTSKIIDVAGQKIFINKIIYQNYIKTGGGKYKLPLHRYKIKDGDIEMPQQTFWFTRVAKVNLNNVLSNSIDQIKPQIIEKNWIYDFVLYCIIFFVLLIILYRNINLTFINRMNGPFAKAHKKIKILHLNNKKDNYVKSILILTDAFNKTLKKNIDSSNFEDLINNNIKYQVIKHEINIFVNVSSFEIYSSKTYFSKVRFNEIYNFTKTLKEIERKV